MNKLPKMAAVQCSSGADIPANKAQLAGLVADAAAQGAQLILLPEMCLCMDGAQYRDMAADPAHTDWLSALAAEHQVWLLAGAVPQADPHGDQRVRSALLVYNERGEQVCRYDKIHLFDVDVGDAQGRYMESERFAPGDEILVVDTPFGKVGLSICFDLRFPQQYEALRKAGAEIIVVPAAFTHRTGEAHWEVLLRARAIEQQCYVLAANQCGWHDDKRQTWGHSMIIDPWGKVVVQLGEEKGVAVAEFDAGLVQSVRTKMPLQR